ncbi:MAG TPA: YfhO family protein, partial [Candidatus Dormibacteraeota bacterium]|nr:YfhO family protein [Candidatus Dormibacteraeota bacterium]
TITRREMYFPGWIASVNGRAVPISRADSIFQAVPVPRGRSTIRFEYEPEYISAGLVAALVGLLLLLVELALSVRARNQPRCETPTGGGVVGP